MIYVVFGKSGVWTNPQALNAAFLNGSNGFELDGAAAGNYTGISLAAGDVNGDGKADVIIGAYGTTPNGIFAGSVYAVFGKSGAWTTPQTLNGAFLNGTNGAEFDGAALSGFAA